MRFIVLFGLCLPLAVATIVEAGRGNPVAIGILLPIGAAVGLVVTSALLSASTPPPRADPAKIARLERELGFVHWVQGQMDVVDTEAPTTPFDQPIVDGAAVPESAHQLLGVKPPAERNVEDCPRPEGCVIAHSCRKCGADRGQACVGDPYSATFHGAPTFGHKIAKPSGPPRKPSDARRSARPGP